MTMLNEKSWKNGYMNTKIYNMFEGYYHLLKKRGKDVSEFDSYIQNFSKIESENGR